MKVTFISTIDTNVGDDFVRSGLEYLLQEHYKSVEIEFYNINKHIPITCRHGFEFIKSYRYSKILDRIIPKKLTKDKVLNADLVIQSGAPVYWCHEIGGGHCHQNKWFQPIIIDRFLKNRNARLLNIAAGTCQKYHSLGDEFCDNCNQFINQFYKYSAITTVRDKLAKVVLSKIGLDVKVIPCSSIFAVDRYGLKSSDEDYVAVNYMKGGSHFAFGQKINVKKWENEFRKFYQEISKYEKVVFVCHNQVEVNEALKIDPTANVFYEENDFLEYMKFYSRAKFGIMNRVHGAFLMASMGKPSIIIGNDSRTRMAEEIGLRHFFVNDLDYNILLQEYEQLKGNMDNYKDLFKEIKIKALQDYKAELDVL